MINVKIICKLKANAATVKDLKKSLRYLLEGKGPNLNICNLCFKLIASAESNNSQNSSKNTNSFNPPICHYYNQKNTLLNTIRKTYNFE